ncbi:unnamed protein product [Angiostrongylus costaricensis]|uniref:Rad60-SLD domain-containing protein n=1 Tax=Angiostrongylus costaricensis TaxID=334426 RepID=A0A158PHM6_ANGCS|nr:unnamed protein product [Angiostrongylus costaricensis]
MYILFYPEDVTDFEGQSFAFRLDIECGGYISEDEAAINFCTYRVLMCKCEFADLYLESDQCDGMASAYGRSKLWFLRVSKDMLPDLDKSTLADLGVTAVGDQLAILRKGRDASFDMGTDSTAKLRVHITGPAEGPETLSNGSAATGELRKGKLPPDRHEIYHVKMPEGEEARLVDPVITRLGVRGLHSDGASKIISGRVQKRSVQTSENLRLPRSTDDVAIRVRIPSSSEVEERVFRKRPMASPDYLVEDDLSAEDEEFVDDEMIWDEEDDEFDVVEYVEDTRPSVYNRISRESNSEALSFTRCLFYITEQRRRILQLRRYASKQLDVIDCPVEARSCPRV